MRRRLATITLLCVIPLALAGCTDPEAVTDHSGTYVPPDDTAGNIYVQDKADVLSPTVEERIYKLNKRIEKTDDGAQLLVVTVKSLHGDSIESTATALFDRYKPGRKGKDNGLLYLLAVNDHKDRLEVGYGLEAKFTDSAAADIIDAGHDDYKNSDWDKGVDKVLDGVQGGFKAGSASKYLADQEAEQRRRMQRLYATIAIPVLILFAVWRLITPVTGLRRRREDTNNIWYHMCREPDKYPDYESAWSKVRPTVVLPLPTYGSSSYSGSSSSSSGSSWSSSSSSSFGGGSSGGGGASGSW